MAKVVKFLFRFIAATTKVEKNTSQLLKRRSCSTVLFVLIEIHNFFHSVTLVYLVTEIMFVNLVFIVYI